MAVGAFQTIRNLKYRKNADYREKVDIEASDERSRFLRMKSWTITGYIVVLTEAVGAVIALVLGHDMVQRVLLYSVCLVVAVYWAVYVILNQKN